ncbi:unnamed protein product [Caenorhabditis auriculariae]|uniref:Lipase n=1 Tax=Caenorhabditis auriculariae TaxID=2777116 RepID=A0A8S1GUE4_9PELO|nr:unnamed protein product [Caenorhabditis auriculariae]
MFELRLALLFSAFRLILNVEAIDPECYLTVPEIARHFGYASEAHVVRTEDDYILELHRFPCALNESDCRPSDQKKPVVFMQHGLLSDGFCFIPNMPSQSAGFVFADAKFDVWIANSRGTPASQKHIGFGPDDKRFWNFSFDEMARYDLTASIKYVLQTTSREDLYYIGHSQGTMIMFAKLADDASFNKKIRQFHALAPVASVSHIGGLFKLLGKRFLEFAEVLLDRLPYTPLTFPKWVQKLIGWICSQSRLENICSLEIGFIDGNEKMFNLTRLGVYLCHTPAATSLKDLLHWMQLMDSQKVQKYDYGAKGNMDQYGQETPPVYDLTKIRTPTFLYWSKDDILADTDDIRDSILAKMNGTIANSTELPHYSHMDFVFGVNAAQDIYMSMIETMRRDDNQRRKKLNLKAIY